MPMGVEGGIPLKPGVIDPLHKELPVLQLNNFTIVASTYSNLNLQPFCADIQVP
jgi:hypothetical protein